MAFSAFGTSAELHLVGVEKAAAEALGAQVRDDFEFMGQHWRATAPAGLARVNAALAAGEPVIAPPSILPLVRLAERYAGRSGGLLDLANGGLVALWGLHAPAASGGPPPGAAEIRRWLEAEPTMSDLVIDGLELASDNPAVQLDLEPIAAGYGIDVTIAYLRAQGVNNALLRVGNDLRAIGDRAGRPWRVAVPRPSGSGVYGFLAVSGDEAVATVGIYEQAILRGGKVYHGVLDPRTGWPADGALAVTVAHSEAATAAAAARALFIAGPGRWPQVAAAMDIDQALFFDRGGGAQMTPTMAERLARLDETTAVRIRRPEAAPRTETGAETTNETGAQSD
nr:FAD:protein FMN transferase [Thiococcus pfennigii]